MAVDLAQYTISYPQTVDYFVGGDSTTVGVGTSPQWTTQDGDTSYISFLPGTEYAIATFNIYASEMPGIPEEWFANPRIITQSQAMGATGGDPFWQISWYATGFGYLETGTYFEPFRGLYFSGQSAYSTNVWHMSTPFATSDPEDPEADVVIIDNVEYAAFIQYGTSGSFGPTTDWYQYYLDDLLQITWWAGGGTGTQAPEDELRLSLFGLVLPIPMPDIDGAIDVKRRQFWRPRPGW